ncbi:UvrD-helicase domain-containing protein [Eggerthella timonensis]|uniref:UvrD-helicase domain-containing protein n=1 Tax=Eggerthella timonensis TaxID=1871008 RepID=UPI000C766C12|nr:UvrD-helicase domain-containing protein [Eggerthella timonensis]
MNKVLVAVAGAGKTRRIAEEISSSCNRKRILVLTYTERNQLEDANRIAMASGRTNEHPCVMGWMAFLLNQIVRPYLPLLFPDAQLRGLGVSPQTFQYLGGADRYFNKEGDAYPGTLAKLAVEVIKAARQAPLRRLELLYDLIYIDEAQDLRGNDLEIVKMLFKSRIETTVVLDPRQSVIATSKHDTKHKPYRGIKALGFYKRKEMEKLCTIENLNETHRFVPEIARLSDAIIREIAAFPETISHVECKEEHSGVFVIPKDVVEEYASQYGATVLRWNKMSGVFQGSTVANFGECKGMQCDHVVVVATNTINDFLLKGKVLAEESACKFYVAVTRARFSVALAVDDPAKVIATVNERHAFPDVLFQIWSP